MKIKRLGWGIVCIVAWSILIFPGQVKQADKPQVGKEAIPPDFANKVMLSPGIDKSWHGLVSLGEKILEDINTIQNNFKDLKSGPGQIAALLGQRRAVISIEGYELIYGKDSTDFWTRRQAEGTTLEIKVATAYVSNVTGPHLKLPFPEEKALKLPVRGRAFNAAAFVAVEFHFVKKTKEGAVLKNDTYPGELGYQHQWDCHWGE